jgi:hypothetical protein
LVKSTGVAGLVADSGPAFVFGDLFNIVRDPVFRGIRIRWVFKDLNRRAFLGEVIERSARAGWGDDVFKSLAFNAFKR